MKTGGVKSVTYNRDTRGCYYKKGKKQQTLIWETLRTVGGVDENGMVIT